jgi:hypothetical protein
MTEPRRGPADYQGLPSPNLDDRSFDELVTEALVEATRSCPDWTDRSVHDPGVALVEVFAHLTEVMLYRLNRLPDKAYVEFLNLLGVKRHPPAAAWATLVLTRNPGSDASFAIPIAAGTQVVAARSGGADGEPAVFTVTQSVEIAAGQPDLSVIAHHCVVVDGELLGRGTGAPGQYYRVARAPIATTTETLDIVLGVEVDSGTVLEGVAAREFGGRTYEIWRPANTFAGADPAAKVYLLDRAAGVVTFAPALDLRTVDPTGEQAAVGRGRLVTLAAVPPVGREIRLWYRTGGGPAGNVAANTLTTLRTQLGPVSVTNPAPARGGRSQEAMESAVRRGPYEFFALQRAVTAGDFELLATSGSAAVARARAFTRTSMWSFARPGEVEVVLVPYVGAESRPGWQLPMAKLVEHQGDAARQRAQSDLDMRRSLGTSVVTTWARYKPVSVKGRVVVRAEDDPDAVRARIHERLYQTISPLSTPANPSGWPFGEPLRRSNVYRWLEQSEPGVRYVDAVQFVLDEAPDERVRTVAADAYQAGTWYAGSGEVLFRSTDDAHGWEPVGRFPGETVRVVVPCPAAVRPGIVNRPGAVAVLTDLDSGQSRVHVSFDLGESWSQVAELAAGLSDAAWIDRDGTPALVLASTAGLFEVAAVAGAVPLQVLVDPNDAQRSFQSVRTFVSERGVTAVAVAGFGVYLSLAGGRPNTFTNVGLANVGVTAMAVQFDGPVTLLWAGGAEPDPAKPGRGCYRARMFEANVVWEQLLTGWQGGTCRAIAFAGSRALAGSQSSGVLMLDTTAATPSWQPVDVNCGLPLRDRTRFQPVQALATGSSGLTLAGTENGVFGSADALQWRPASNRTVMDVVTVPDTWLLCSAGHDIEVVRDDAT